ncbi:MAG TPA: SgcJ/EcaC family oxidoreductase [Bryobacteraceae bacterium]|nr:SgcJ/EcaC family oxidoreductase [Bryobacteraceae bacterium]
MFSFVLLGVFASSTLWTQPASPTGDEAAARDVVARYMQARNQKDETAVRSLFTPDADQLVSSGEWRRGIDNLVRGAMASSQKETGTSSITVETVRFLEPDIAIIDGRYRTTSSTGDVRNMWTTLVLKRTVDGWRITAIRNMLPVPAKP